MFQRHSSIAHAAYHDLLRSLQDDAVSDIRGTPTRVERNGKTYWYDTYRVGTDVKKRYIGEDSDALRARLTNHNTLKTDADVRRKARTRLVRLLRAESFLGLDAATGSLLAAMAAAGVFRLGGTIVGTHAFRLYEGELGVRFDLDMAAQTDDIDIASFSRLSLALEDAAAPPLEQVFRDLSFTPQPSLHVGRTWRWKQTRGNTLVEFLTPSFEADEGLRELPALGVDAQALHHLNYLIAAPIKAAVTYRSGVLVQIPQPERFAIHKLIVANRRRTGDDALKSEKDRRQAAFLIEFLAQDRPDELRDAYEDAMSRGPKWRERIEASLERMPATAALLRQA
ncbi:nucleotidyltransferase family protein [Ruegeria aquimaris]|uniref:GSU2403 family nucleotidyltransferase fold protein n=1 Tax=Ruegeria aquimaris TaxID=2984333 RepID=A0ABT3ATE0_9RHOB|nr:GSU2403 family nucleotidyltransferase fold protein [Ruegeria sp. XHP0148]MCV2891406.1 GSU2403 family nucleotidyltransferase fold protein [Ruegeria sp. XHP0148]